MSHDSQPSQPVVNPLPPVVVALALAIFAVEVLLSAGARGLIGGDAGVGWRVEAIQSYGFFAPLLEVIVQRQMWTTPELVRFVSYPFIHLGFTHVLFVIVFLLALGKLVGEALGGVAVIATFFISAIFGALVFAGLTGDPRPLVGGYPAVYGLIGTYTFILWVSYGQTGQNQYQAFTLIGFLLGIQLFFGVFFGSSSEWVAEVAGFIVGFLVAPFVARGGMRRMLARIRQR
jgi:rhomboid protease GluP